MTLGFIFLNMWIYVNESVIGPIAPVHRANLVFAMNNLDAVDSRPN